MQATIQSYGTLVERSAGTEEFKKAALGYEKGNSSPLIRTNPGAPPVKIMRVLSKLMEDEPELEIREVSIEGRSGCSDFTGRLIVNGDREYRFVWDCKWRAEQEGWKDHWGMPDQMRAARQFGYQCFETFERVK